MEDTNDIQTPVDRRPFEPIVLPWPCASSHEEFVEWSGAMYREAANFAAILNDDPTVSTVASGVYCGSVSLTGKRTVAASRKHVKRRMTRRLIRRYELFREQMKCLSNRVAEKIEADFLRKVMQ